MLLPVSCVLLVDLAGQRVPSAQSYYLQFNLGIYPSGVVKNVLFVVVGEAPLLCNVHAEMAGFVVTLGKPYFVVIDFYYGVFFGQKLYFNK